MTSMQTSQHGRSSCNFAALPMGITKGLILFFISYCQAVQITVSMKFESSVIKKENGNFLYFNPYKYIVKRKPFILHSSA